MHSRVCERKTTRSLGILKNTIKNGKKCTNLVPNVFVSRSGKKEKEKKNIPNDELLIGLSAICHATKETIA